MEREKDERAQKRKRSQLGLGVRLRVSVRRRTNKKKTECWWMQPREMKATKKNTSKVDAVVVGSL